MIRMHLAELSNGTAAAVIDTTLFDKVWKVKGLLEIGMPNKDIAVLTTEKASDANDMVVGMTAPRVSMIAQVHVTSSEA